MAIYQGENVKFRCQLQTDDKIPYTEIDSFKFKLAFVSRDMNSIVVKYDRDIERIDDYLLVTLTPSDTSRMRGPYNIELELTDSSGAVLIGRSVGVILITPSGF